MAAPRGSREKSTSGPPVPPALVFSGDNPEKVVPVEDLRVTGDNQVRAAGTWALVMDVFNLPDLRDAVYEIP